MQIIDYAFNNVIPISLPAKPEGSAGGASYLGNVATMQVGVGGQVFRADQSGIWLGAETFAAAPFSVDMNGNMIGSSVNLSGSGYSKITIFKQAGIPTSVSVGDLWFDSDDGNKMYRAGSVGADAIIAGEWELVASTTISIFAQDAIPTSLAVGDLWYDTNDSNKPYRAASVGANEVIAGEWILINDLRAADALLKAGTSQTLTGNFNLNDSNVLIDGANKRIIINDGTNDRILIGYQSAGF